MLHYTIYLKNLFGMNLSLKRIMNTIHVLNVLGDFSHLQSSAIQYKNITSHLVTSHFQLHSRIVDVAPKACNK